MTKLPSVSSDDVIRVLQKVGFTYAPKRGKGSHRALYRIDEDGGKRLVIVPKNKDLLRNLGCNPSASRIVPKGVPPFPVKKGGE